MTDCPPVSIVVPLYRSASTLEPLLARLGHVLSPAHVPAQVVFVDDACPESSGESAVRLDPPDGVRVEVWRHSRNGGQLAAVRTGLARADGEIVCIMDADLQDDPADLPALIGAVRSRGAGTLVCAGRRGDYSGRLRVLTGRAFRWVRHVAGRGAIPVDAGLFCAMTSADVGRLLALDDPAEHPLTAAVRAGVRVESLPIVRQARHAGTSATSWQRRVWIAADALVPLTPARPLLARRHRRVMAGITCEEVGRSPATTDPDPR